MSDPSARENAQGTAHGAENPRAAAPGEAAATHPYAAASNQREQVLTGFEEQRKAILKAVADQREAVLNPIKNVQARQTARAGATFQGSANQQSVAADIVATLKAMVAEEVRVQLLVILEAATLRENSQRDDGSVNASPQT